MYLTAQSLRVNFYPHSIIFYLYCASLEIMANKVPNRKQVKVNHKQF